MKVLIAVFRPDSAPRFRNGFLPVALAVALSAAARGAPSLAESSAKTRTSESAPPGPSDSRQAARPGPLDKQGEIDLIRGLSSEIAVAKVALPRGKHGIIVDARGQINQNKARQEIKDNGAAINAGTPVKISKIDFKGDRLVFEINGGGRNGRHWYQHIEISAGGAAVPVGAPQGGPGVAQTLAYGSYITLKFAGHVPNLTVDETKRLLAPALDFERHSPTVLYSPAVPPKFKEAIKNHHVVVGMDHDAVLSAKGPPDRKVREDQPDGGEKEDWIYGLPPHVLFITFDGDTVVSVKQY